MRTHALSIACLISALFTSVSLRGAAEDLQTFPAKPGGDTKVRVEGTSTIHDWRLQGSVIGGSLKAGKDFPTEPGQEVKPGPVTAEINAFIPVRSLTSREKDGSHYSDRMDEVVYEHLDQKTYSRIFYHLTKLTLKQAPASKDGAYVFDSEGTLAVHGVTNAIAMPVNVTPLGGKAIRFTGSANAKMSDFKISPPAPTGLGMLIKTGDDVKLIFDWTVQQKPAPAAK